MRDLPTKDLVMDGKTVIGFGDAVFSVGLSVEESKHIYDNVGRNTVNLLRNDKALFYGCAGCCARDSGVCILHHLLLFWKQDYCSKWRRKRRHRWH